MFERRGQTTRSFDHWLRAERQLRSFLEFGLRFGNEGLAKHWQEIELRPSDGREETIDIFDRELGGLGPHEFEWLHASAIVKDAVTLYEVYLEQAAAEVLLRHGLEWETTEAPKLRELRDFYLLLGVDLYAEEGVRPVRRLRHLLTHRRGAPETDDDRATYGSDYPSHFETVELNAARVRAAMDVLARSVRRIDIVACNHSWGSERVPALHDLLAALTGEGGSGTGQA